MSLYYTPKRTKGLFNPLAKDFFKISRSKIDLFLECPRCFYLDRRLGVSRPPGFPFNLNSAVDILLKKEFDIHRAGRTAHPLMKKYGLDLVPFRHPDIEKWRNTLHGVQHRDETNGLLVFGAIDDLWVDAKGELRVVDYKATSKDSEVNLDADWQDGYKRQMEIYQWLLEKNGFQVSQTGYFVYANGRRDRKAFDGRLEFDVSIIPYKGDRVWVSKVLAAIKQCLLDDRVPKAKPDCDFCNYGLAVEAVAPFKRKIDGQDKKNSGQTMEKPTLF